MLQIISNLTDFLKIELGSKKSMLLQKKNDTIGVLKVK